MTVKQCQTLVRQSLDMLLVQLNQNEFIDITEATLQHHLAMNLHLLANAEGIPFKIALEKRISLDDGEFLKNGLSEKIKTVSALDVYFELGEDETRCAMELKFFKHENHREPNNRYDAYVDIGNLEIALDQDCDIAYFLLLTDHPHYYDPNYRQHNASTGSFCLRNGHIYEAGRELFYNTETPHGREITLRNNYRFSWENLRENYKVLLLQVGA